MQDSEKLIEMINTISSEKCVGVFEATIIFCEDNKVDIEDIIKILDISSIERIKTDALNNNIVCNRKLFAKKTTSLF